MATIEGRSLLDLDCLAIIPARGGSQGIPRKNLRLVAGRPLIAYTIDAALAARTISRVVVSTDDREIADVARCYGADVIERPAGISGNEASSESAILHALERLKHTEGRQPAVTVMLQCTSPLTLAEDIDGVVQVLLEQGADSALSTTTCHQFLWRVSADGRICEGVNHDGGVRQRRQDMAKQFVETGAVYAMSTPRFLAEQTRFCGRTVMHVTPPDRHLELDELAHIALADAALRARYVAAKSSLLPNRVDALVLDFDGVLTDNTVNLNEAGEEGVTSSRGDGMGIAMLRGRGVPVLVLSTELNPIVTYRCNKLGVECFQGLCNKLETLRHITNERRFELGNIVYVGNDINDLDCMRAAGCAACPADAHSSARDVAQLVLTYPGGRGAVRELCDLILIKLDSQMADDPAKPATD